MEVMRVVTSSLLVLCVSGPSLALYPYTRGGVVRNNWGGQLQQDPGLLDYFSGYTTEEQQQQYPLSDYEPRYTYANERPRINKEAMAAWLNAALDDYILNYDTYNDDDGTWYNEMATDTLTEPSSDDSPMMRFFFNGQKPQSSSPYRYSLEDLENMERRARLEEDNTENQLHALRAQTMTKKSNMPVLGSRMPIAGRITARGQKEEAFNIPATSVRRPVFGRTITTQTDEDKRAAEQNQKPAAAVERSTTTTQKPENKKKKPISMSKSENEVTSTDTAPAAAVPSSSSSSPKNTEDSSEAGTQFLKRHYDTLKKFLERERQVRMNQDMEDELRREKMQKRGMQKRYAAAAAAAGVAETLPEQLASLKKKV